MEFAFIHRAFGEVTEPGFTGTTWRLWGVTEEGRSGR